jgi:hypothetical protein
VRILRSVARVLQINILCFDCSAETRHLSHKRHYDNPAEGKNKLSFYPSRIFAARRGLCLEARGSLSGRKYLTCCVFTERKAAQDIDGYARSEIRGGSIGPLDRKLCLG